MTRLLQRRGVEIRHILTGLETDPIVFKGKQTRSTYCTRAEEERRVSICLQAPGDSGGFGLQRERRRDPREQHYIPRTLLDDLLHTASHPSFTGMVFLGGEHYIISVNGDYQRKHG